jgi:hypothetical protein
MARVSIYVNGDHELLDDVLEERVVVDPGAVLELVEERMATGDYAGSASSSALYATRIRLLASGSEMHASITDVSLDVKPSEDRAASVAVPSPRASLSEASDRTASSRLSPTARCATRLRNGWPLNEEGDRPDSLRDFATGPVFRLSSCVTR